MTVADDRHEEADTNSTSESPGSLPVDGENVGLVRELIELIVHNKKWWLAPVIIVLLLIGLLIAVGSTALAPYLYPLF
jgi:hypothetical protein